MYSDVDIPALGGVASKITTYCISNLSSLQFQSILQHHAVILVNTKNYCCLLRVFVNLTDIVSSPPNPTIVSCSGRI